MKSRAIQFNLDSLCKKKKKKARAAHLDGFRDVEFEQDDLDEVETDHQVAGVLFAFDERAVAADEFAAEALEGRARVRHEVVEEDVDRVAGRLGMRFQVHRGQDSACARRRQGRRYGVRCASASDPIRM